MTTMEKLFVQIFERKNSIIQQVKHQTDLYNQNLASKLLIDGIPPPSWLWNPNFDSQSSDPKELNKEELISELLLPHRGPTFPYSSSYCSLYSKPAVTGDNGDLSDGSFMETHTLEKYTDAGDGSKAVPKCHVNDTDNCLNCVPGLDSRVTSIQDPADGVIMETHASDSVIDAENRLTTMPENCVNVSATSPQAQADLTVSNFAVLDHSLARIQRSKSRQTALKLRNSENATSRKRLSNEKKLGRIDSQTVDHANVLFESNKPSYANKENYFLGVQKEGSQSKKIGTSSYSGRITRSRSSCKQHSDVNESLKAEKSVHIEKKDDRLLPEEDLEHRNNVNRSSELVTENCVVRDSTEKPSTPNEFPNLEKSAYSGNAAQTIGKLMQQSNDANELPEFVKSSSELNVRKTRSQTAEFVRSSSEFMQQSKDANELPEFIRSSSELIGRKTRSQTACSNEGISKNTTSMCTMSTDDLKEQLNDANELAEAVKPSSKLSGRKTRSQTACINEEISKPVNRSGSEGLVLRLPSGSLMAKQLDFYGLEENNLENTSCPPFDKKMTNKSSGQICCNPSAVAASVDKVPPRSSDESVLEQQSLVEEMSFKEKDDLRRSNDDTVENFVEDERTMFGSNINPKMQNIEDNSEVILSIRNSTVLLEEDVVLSVHKNSDVEIHQVICQSSEGYRSSQKPQVEEGDRRETGSGEADLFYGFAEAKHGEDGNLGHLKPKRLQLENNFSPSSSKVDSWPQFKRRKVEDHLADSFSTSPSFRAQKLRTTQGDPGSSRCLKNSENNLDDVSPLNANMSFDVGICQQIKCDSTLGVESSLMLQQKEAELGSEEKNEGADFRSTDKRKQTGLSIDRSLTKQADQDPHGCSIDDIKTAAPTTHILNDRYKHLLHLENKVNGVDADDLTADETIVPEPQSCSFKSRHNSDLDLTGSELEAFILDSETENGSISTPFSQFSFELNPHTTNNHYKSVPNGVLERVDLQNPILSDEASYSGTDENMTNYTKASYSACLPYSSAKFGWNSKNLYSSPVGKLWERISSGSSEKRISSNPELTCFTIEEDPGMVEENENSDEVAHKIQETIEREPLSEITEACLHPPVSIAEKFQDRGSLDSISTEVSFAGTHNSAKRKLRNRYRDKGSTNESIEGRNGIEKLNKSLHNRFNKPKLSGKTSVKRGEQRFSEKVPIRNNIVSNITSFVPLVQQKQAAAVCTGKRDVKVKALEAAEAAKRLEEKRQNERKMKKEAMKVERARIEQENLRQKELDKKKKEDEQKKKDADKAARKRLREEEEKKEKGRKRNKIEEVRRQVKIQEERSHVGEVEKEKPCDKKDDRGKSGKESENPKGKSQHAVKTRENEKILEKSETVISTSDIQEAVDPCNDKDKIKVLDNSDKSAETDNPGTKKTLEKSYEISPYQCSDDEEDDENDIRTKKFIPSWASKNCVALVLSSQRKIDPDLIFPRESFCSMDEVLLSRKLQPK